MVKSKFTILSLLTTIFLFSPKPASISQSQRSITEIEQEELAHGKVRDTNGLNEIQKEEGDAKQKNIKQKNILLVIGNFGALNTSEQ
jgi:hypothetical protein